MRVEAAVKQMFTALIFVMVIYEIEVPAKNETYLAVHTCCMFLSCRCQRGEGMSSSSTSFLSISSPCSSWDDSHTGTGS